MREWTRRFIIQGVMAKLKAEYFPRGMFQIHRKCMKTGSFAYKTEVLHTYISGLSQKNTLLSEADCGSASHLFPNCWINEMTFSNLEYEKTDHLGLVTFSHNVESTDDLISLQYEFDEVCLDLNDDSDVWTVVVRGIERIPEFPDENYMSLILDDCGLPVPNTFSETIENIEKPVIGTVEGDIAGLGLETLLACDFRIASDKSTFQMTYLNKGLFPFSGGTQRLTRLVGKGKALEMLYLCEKIEANEAIRIGLVSRIAKRDEQTAILLKIARKIASRGPVALRYVKEAVNKGMDLTLEQGLRLEADLYMLLHTTKDRIEGIRAFQKQKKPEFLGE
jgi:enoyl-CoA hydratase/carnithine racemase